MRQAGQKGFYLVSILLLSFATFNLYTSLAPRPHLTRDFLRTAYHTYSATNIEADMEQLIEKFPVDHYERYAINGPSYFYLDPEQDIIKDYLRVGATWEPNIQALMQKYVKQGTNVIDVGAHIGTHTVFLANLLNNTGEVWAFEPQKKIFMELNANLLANKASKVHALRMALGDHHGKASLSKAAAGNEGHTAVGQGGDDASMVRLDDMHISNVSLIKIDVEGYEDRVLDGARQTISASKPVIFIEIQGGAPLEVASKEERERIRVTITKLKSMGYQVSRIGKSDYLALPL